MNQKFTYKSIESGQTSKVNVVAVGVGGAGISGNALILSAVDGARYQLVDIVTFVLPQKLQIKRKGADSHTAQPDGNIEAPDVVTKDYFKAKGGQCGGARVTGALGMISANWLAILNNALDKVARGSGIDQQHLGHHHLTYIAKLMIIVGLSVQFTLAQAQVFSPAPPPLTLYEVLDNASNFYPSLRAARFEAHASTEDTTAVRRQRWPAVTVTSETNTGNLRSYPTQAVQVQQTLWDFGRLSARIAEAEAAADVSLLNVYLQQQDLFLQIISAWQNLQAGRERAKVAESTLERLKAYQAQMRRRVEAEASPHIDLELVGARLLQTEVELTAAKTSLQVAVTRLEQLSGLERLRGRVSAATPMPNLKETLAFTGLVKSTDWFYITQKGPLVAKARAQLKQAEQRFEGKKSEAWPQVYARAYKPMNTIPSSNDKSTTTFIGLSYTPGAGFATMAEAQALGTRISGAQMSVESAILEMQQTLQSDVEEYVNARLRIAALEKSVEGSELVLASYKRQFEAGKKTWLDLLNAVRELAQNQYSLADAQATMLGAMHRLQLRMGEQPQ